MQVRRAFSRVAVLLVVAAVAALPMMADSLTYTYTDPADLHIGTGYGTPGAQGLGSDPNLIGTGGLFDIYYNTQGNGNGQLEIGNPFYLIFAVPVYSGSSSANSAPLMATFYNYDKNTNTTTTSNVSVGPQTGHGTIPSTSPNQDIYDWLGWGDVANNSYQEHNMSDCDTGLTTCPNSSLWGANAPLAGKTITGFDIFTYTIGTTSFGPGDTLDFQGSSLPLGSFVVALGVVDLGPDKKGVEQFEGWAVPFTQTGLVTDRKLPEPASLALLGAGFLALGTLGRRRLRR